MFYSHEILTNRKYGVATVWLVATLGAKSHTTKKLSRKKIIEVSVKKACETIMEPEAPMALRLQSSLLYGVSRVYDQQCSYVLQDAQLAQTALRSLIKSSRDNQLDAGAGKARPEQLVLLDDPAFFADNPLPAFDFDFQIVDPGDNRSTQSMLSIRGRSGSADTSQAMSALGINIPSSSGNSQYRLPSLNFGDSPIQRDLGRLGREEEEDFINNEDLFGFNEDGQLMEGNEAEREQLRAGAISIGHRPSDSAASGRVRKEHEDGRAIPFIAGDDDFVINYGDDNVAVLPDAEPFVALPFMAGGLGGRDQPQNHLSQDRVFSEEEVSSVSVRAPQVKRRKPNPKKLAVDNYLVITSAEIKQWHLHYLTNMAASALVKDHLKAKTQAKKNALHFVLGGLNGTGFGVGLGKLASPLAMFAGESLLKLVAGRSLPPTVSRGSKRKAEKEISPKPKRLRESEQGRYSPSDKHPAINEDAGFMAVDDNDLSQSVEVGRDAASEMPDHPSSALMPWNKSASLHSYNRNVSSQHGRGSQFGSGVGSQRHRVSASPLIGRGSALPGDIEQLMALDDDEMHMYGREDDFDFGAGGGISSSVRDGFQSRLSHPQAAEEFELFGQAANVDTQTAAQSQWVRDALDKESNNFFEYVRNTIEEKREDGGAMNGINESVTFEELFDPKPNSPVVAAQAFYHVLFLASKRRVWVEQDVEDLEPFGEIRIGVVAMI